ncbi:putative MATE family efflux protein [Winogradskyella epiphytica]|uniref:Multidrug-efflux transporter n=1 Tax=Winogradskyella epiphytica TaxID=262005 RepID=A0A2V4X133_9FLAO|nr:MATE family efflux transporter [Winogradskyella epiphytica]PYE83388.1 putative MATE family efflux protein [Winogradskyella epiphytica]GGW57803.1 MATE family efflux transporter [Winogradskyella epiphytica]
MSSTITLKQINKLAIPALIAGVSEPILSLTDAAIIGNMEYNATESLAAVGIVTTFLSMLIWVLGQTRSAISSIVSQYLGAGKIEAVKNLPAQAIFLITSLSLLIIVITYPLASHIFKFYNASDTILSYSVDYYRIRVFGFPFTLFTIAVFGTFRGLQNTYYPMLIAISGALANIILDFAFVYGVDGVIPAMHIKGAAYASVIAQLLMAGLSAYFILKKTDIPLIVKFPFNPEIKRFVLMILNLFIRTIALNIALYFGTSFATKYGASYIAAYTIAINLWFLGAFLIDGYASAGNILSGKLLGAKDYKNLIELSNKLIKYGIIAGSIIAVIGALFYYPIGHLFSNDDKVLKEFYSIFWIILAMQPLCALAFIFDGVFKGLGRMKYLRNVLLFSTLVVFIPIVLWTDALDYKLYGIFTAFTLWMVARGLPLIIKFRKTFKPLAENM